MRRWAVVLVVVSSFSAYAQRKHEPRPWEWNDEDRIAKRMAMTIKTPSSEIRYRIDGNTNPELFLPLELFQWLVSRIEDGGASFAGAKRYLAPEIVRFGWEEKSFWQQLETVTSHWRELDDRSLSLQYAKSIAAPPERRRLDAENEKVRDELCPARVAALKDARRLFGDRFDEFLYSTLTSGHAASSSGTEETHRRLLRILSGVCE